VGVMMVPARAAGRRATAPPINNSVQGFSNNCVEVTGLLAPTSNARSSGLGVREAARMVFSLFPRKQGSFPRKTGRRSSTNGQSPRGIRDFDNFSKSKITERKQGGDFFGNSGRPVPVLASVICGYGGADRAGSPTGDMTRGERFRSARGTGGAGGSASRANRKSTKRKST
jgi:hypothetical protein